MEAIVRPVRLDDAAVIARIYNNYVLHTIITFEEEPVTTQEMSARINEASSAGLPWVVAESSSVVLGYAYASKWKGRSAYRFSVESTVYLDPAAKRQGIGSMLYEALITQLRDQNYHAVIGGIALPNEASIRLHERFGFQKVAQFKEVGLKFGRWVDVGYWQMTLLSPDRSAQPPAQNRAPDER